MPELGVFSGEEICRILETEGFLRVCQKGSHTILQKRTEHDHRPREVSSEKEETADSADCADGHLQKEAVVHGRRNVVHPFKAALP